MVVEARSLSSTCGQGWFFPESLSENLSQASFLADSGLLAIFGVSWLGDTSP